MLRCPFILLLTLLVGEAQAQCGVWVEEPEPDQAQRDPDEIVSVVAATQRMTQNIAFIVDSSQSMTNAGRMDMAIRLSQSILGQEGDELVVALFAFKATHTRWPGMPHDGAGPPPPEGWTEFPGADRLESAQQWLMAQGASGSTNPISAINEAMAEDVKNLTIVLITDGEDFDVPGFLQAVRDGQTAREARGVGRAVIVVVGIGPNSRRREHLQTVGREGGGGMYAIRPPRTSSDGD